MPAVGLDSPRPGEPRSRRQLRRPDRSRAITNRDTFLTRIDGLIYGDDPAQGVIEGNRFIHPDLRLSFTAPNGFYMVNGTRAVSINGQSGQAQLGTGPYNGNLETYVRQVFAGAEPAAAACPAEPATHDSQRPARDDRLGAGQLG